MFEEAGFEDVREESRMGTGRFPDIRTLVGAGLRGWLPVMGVHLQEDTIASILEAGDREMAGFVSEGKVVFDSPGAPDPWKGVPRVKAGTAHAAVVRSLESEHRP